MIGKRFCWLAAACVFAVIGPSSLYSQGEPTPSGKLTSALETVDEGATAPVPMVSTAVSEPSSALAAYRSLQETNKRLWLIIIAVLTVVVLVVAHFFLRLSGKATGKDVINCTGLVVVVFSTVFLVVVTNTNEQMTAAIGIIGAVAGYLFGQVTAKPESPPESSRTR